MLKVLLQKETFPYEAEVTDVAGKGVADAGRR